jgi:hypothetical protein
VWLAAAAALVLAVGCSSSTSSGTNPSISAKSDRSKDGVLQGLTVTGKHFTPNGMVLVTTLMAASGANASPYVEETIQADANGKIKWEKKPVPCPQTGDYGKGSWTSVVARDTTSGISDARTLDPGSTPDCSA